MTIAVHLRRVTLGVVDAPEADRFPFDVPAILPMAFPGATILSFDRVPIVLVAYEDLDHVTITRDFVNDPASYLRRL